MLRPCDRSRGVVGCIKSYSGCFAAIVVACAPLRGPALYRHQLHPHLRGQSARGNLGSTVVRPRPCVPKDCAGAKAWSKIAGRHTEDGPDCKPCRSGFRRQLSEFPACLTARGRRGLLLQSYDMHKVAPQATGCHPPTHPTNYQALYFFDPPCGPSRR